MTLQDHTRRYVVRKRNGDKWVYLDCDDRTMDVRALGGNKCSPWSTIDNAELFQLQAARESAQHAGGEVCEVMVAVIDPAEYPPFPETDKYQGYPAPPHVVAMNEMLDDIDDYYQP